MEEEGIAQILAQIQVGDKIHSTTIVLTPKGIRDGGSETALVVIGKSARHEA